MLHCVTKREEYVEMTVKRKSVLMGLVQNTVKV